MNKQDSFGNVVMVLKVLAFFILLVLSHQTVTEFNEINQITGFAIMEAGFENTIIRSGGGTGNIRNIYTIITEDKACIGRPVQILIIDSLGNKAEGLVKVFYERNQRWIQKFNVDLKDGRFMFTPTKQTMYKVVFGDIEKIIKVNNCAKKEQTLHKQKPLQKIEEQIPEEESLIKMKKIATTGLVTTKGYVRFIKKYPLPIIVSLIILAIFIILFIQKKHHKQLKLKAKKHYKKYKKHKKAKHKKLKSTKYKFKPKTRKRRWLLKFKK